MKLPETTTRLLKAVQASRDLGRENYRANTVEISDAGITCYPVKSKFVSEEIERAGIAEKVAFYIYEKTRYRVSGKEIKVLI